ncbi:hypothetical protein J4205_03280 [Candidatus Pacearchaeota archaeon]|nr:hypothetical protein [Candidatus Pacearchaeota archaeon]
MDYGVTNEVAEREAREFYDLGMELLKAGDLEPAAISLSNALYFYQMAENNNGKNLCVKALTEGCDVSSDQIPFLEKRANTRVDNALRFSRYTIFDLFKNTGN